LIITGTGGIWTIVRRRGIGGRTETSSSSGLSSEMMINNNRQEEEDYRFTPKNC
jgi:hypothetical protein